MILVFAHHTFARLMLDTRDLFTLTPQHGVYCGTKCYVRHIFHRVICACCLTNDAHVDSMKVRSQNANDNKPKTNAVCVDVNLLTVGAKIVGFERPWNESGESSLSFTITGAAELSELRAQHNSVYIEVTDESTSVRASSSTAIDQYDGADRPIVIWDQSAEATENGGVSHAIMQRLKKTKRFFSRRKKTAPGNT